MDNSNIDRLFARAALAFFKDWVNHPHIKRPALWPNRNATGWYRYNARDFVVLRAQAGSVLAVYRIRPSNGTLRRLFNYPMTLNTEPGPSNPLYQKIRENKT